MTVRSYTKWAPKESPETDPSTLSNYNSFLIKNTNLDFKVLFDQQVLKGEVEYQLDVLEDITEIVLDTSFIAVHNVSVDGGKRLFTVNERQGPLGSSLVIDYCGSKNTSITVKIGFQTTKQCTAIQFLDKEATDGKLNPYLFSQCEAIHARSLFPCFDTPALKSRFNMSIESPYNSVMSGRPVECSEPNTYRFIQPVPIPSYLVALASGDIAKAPIGPRSHIYCEPVHLDKCQLEFQDDMESFIDAAEKIVFNYEWDQYDALILPSSFPYGGMENPNVTFATPTIVTGDKQNIDVIAHELAHSWAGNLVTNCSWEHFWLNEGWCVYLERRILGAIHGEAGRHFAAIIGWFDLDNSIKAMGESASRFSTLVQNLKGGGDPDDSFSTVPYEKGSTLLMHIETILTQEKFNGFIPHYFNTFKYKSLDTYQFIDCLYDYFTEDHEKLDSIDWDSWLFKPGMPPVKPEFDTSLVDQCYDLADKWYLAVNSGANLYDLFTTDDIKDLTANQSVVFLETLIAYDKHHHFNWKENLNALNALNDIYGSVYSQSANSEVVSRWYILQVQCGHNEAFFDILGQWLGTVGRMKFVRPGYVALNSVDHNKALHYFMKFQSTYHPICKAMVMKDLGLE